ncbi:hypothetical protein H4582DRAFT_2074868 [Lactarius indigo]|nr:hypothetical protein H4582DRAFT_2074868 [Lactarius indigo]
MANSQDGYYHQHLARGHDGATRQMYAPSVQGARGQPSQPGVESNLAGPGMVRTPSVYSPPGHSPPGVVTSPPPQIGYQQTNRPYVALSPSNGGRGTSQQSGNMSSVPSSSGQYAPNPPATHVPPITSASPMRQQWSEGGYRASGGGVSPTYVTAELQPSPTTRTSGVQNMHANSVHPKVVLPRNLTAPILPGIICLDAKCHTVISQLSSTST